MIFLEVDGRVAHCEEAHLRNDFVVRRIKRKGAICFELPVIPECDGYPSRDWGDEPPLEEDTIVRVIIWSVEIRVKENSLLSQGRW